MNKSSRISKKSLSQGCSVSGEDFPSRKGSHSGTWVALVALSHLMGFFFYYYYFSYRTVKLPKPLVKLMFLYSESTAVLCRGRGVYPGCPCTHLQQQLLLPARLLCLGPARQNVPCNPPASDSSAGLTDLNSACSQGSFSNGNRASVPGSTDDSGLSCP